MDLTTDTNRIRTAVIVGSTRPGRRGLGIAEWVAAAEIDGLALELVDLAEIGLPLLAEPVPAISGEYREAETRDFSELIAGFDAFVLVTPEYNHSTSGVLKNALDHLYAEWVDKPVAFVGYGVDGGQRAVEHLRTICVALGMAVVGPQVSIDVRQDLAAGGGVALGRQVDAREQMLGTLSSWAGALRTLRPGAPSSHPASVAGDGRAIADRLELRPTATAAVDDFVAGIQAALDAGDATAYDAPFAADVLWGSPYGATVAGIEPLAAAHRSLMSRGVATHSRYEVVDVLAPAPGVAVAQVRRVPLDDSEDPFAEMALYVLIERAGQWWLAAGHNTPITAKP